MSVAVTRDRRAERFAATRQEILDAAWELARAEGLVGIAMRDLGLAVGMRAQSLYAYFPSKHAMYDAMFAEGNIELLARVEAVDEPDPERRLRAHAKGFVGFCVEDPVRHQLLFQRTVPGFEPSPESYAAAVQVLALARRTVVACGVPGTRAFDAWTAITAGIAAQQNANEPGGRRWARLVDEAVDIGVTAASAPPASITSAMPWRMYMTASPTAIELAAQAVQDATSGPRVPQLDRHVRRAHVRDQRRHPERREPVDALREQVLVGDEERVQPADARADRGADAVGLRRDLQAGVGDGLAGRRDGEVRVAVGAARGLLVEVQRRVEVLDLARHLHRRRPRRRTA